MKLEIKLADLDSEEVKEGVKVTISFGDVKLPARISDAHGYVSWEDISYHGKYKVETESPDTGVTTSTDGQIIPGLGYHHQILYL